VTAPAPAPQVRAVRLVVPRYGPEVSGGSERLVRRLAQVLARRRWDVEVWTTTAADEASWAPAFPAGDDLDGPVRVRRFPILGGRHPAAFHQLSRAVFHLPAALRPETAWVLAQGPFSPSLVRALATAPDRPTLFMPYLYHPTLWGLPAAPHPRLLIPAAHDEPALRLRAVRRALLAADGLWYSTEEERRLVEAVHPGAAGKPHAIGTTGVAIPRRAAEEDFRRRHSLGRYLLYAGRLTPGKGVALLLEGFALLRQRHPALSLVVIGDRAGLAAPPPGVVSLGWVEDAEHRAALAGAEAIVIPSRLESLSLVALEGWAWGRPCLVNGASAVLAGQAARSGGALLFDTAKGLAEQAAAILDDPETARRLGAAGRSFVAAHYRWEDTVRRLTLLIAAADAGVRHSLAGAHRPPQPSPPGRGEGLPVPAAEEGRPG
jgi:glycosyltransferase involved in cell wall biosynthesis